MELYILDPLLRRIEIIDRFESLIWTERWASYGDFEMLIQSTFENRALLRTDVKVIVNRSLRVMNIETIEDDVTEEGVAALKIKGRSIETVFDDRVARAVLDNLTDLPVWSITSPPADLMRQLVTDSCVTISSTRGEDQIPFMTMGRHPLIPASSIDEPADPIKVELEPQSLYEVLTSLADTWNLGFRLLIDASGGQLYFDVYSGTDRTASQVTRPPILFSVGLDNLQNTSNIKTIEGSKNVAYVFALHGFLEVRPEDLDIDIEGFERRVLTVNAKDIELAAGPDLDAAMLQRGKEALSAHRALQAFDGEIRQDSQYKYGIDYHLGDLVEMRDSDGVGNQMRVTEQIFVHDKEGERSYPTLSLNTFVNTGSWLSYDSNKRWIDYEDDYDTVWSSLP